MTAHPPQVIQIHCKECGDPMRVVKGSKAHKESICNLCIYAKILPPVENR